MITRGGPYSGNCSDAAEVAINVERFNHAQGVWERHPAMWRTPRPFGIPSRDQMGMLTDTISYVSPQGRILTTQEDEALYRHATAHFLTPHGFAKLVPARKKELATLEEEVKIPVAVAGK